MSVHRRSKMSRKMASETTIFDQAHRALQTAIKFMRQKFRAADSYHGKEARAFWNESKDTAEKSLAFLEQNIYCLQINTQDQFESLEDSIERMRMGYAEYRDQLSLAYWTLSASIDLKERLEGRGLIRVQTCADAADTIIEAVHAVDGDIFWGYPEVKTSKGVRPSTWQREFHRIQTPADAGVFYAR